MTADIESKINRLVESFKDGRPDAHAEIISIQKTLKVAMLKKNLKEHPALVQLLNVLKKREEGMTLVLANKEDLPHEERMALFQRRREIRFVISFFNVEPTIDSIEKTLDYQLSDEVNDLSTP